jgi:hypothetical protein
MYPQNSQEQEINTIFDQDFYERKPRWEILLSNGIKVFDTDQSNKSTWISLKEYCRKNNLKIVQFSIGFRDNVVTLPNNKDAYYFRRMSKFDFGSERTSEYFIVGYKDGDGFEVQKYIVPEMILDGRETRYPEENDDSVI